MNIKKVLAAVLAVVMLLLVGCGAKGIKRDMSDGTVVYVDANGSNGLVRAPIYKISTNNVTMEFNGIDWFSFQIVEAAEIAEFESYELLAESSNMKVYETEEEFPYIYILDLEGSDVAFIKFESNGSPETASISNDFNNVGLAYRVDGVTTTPDCEWVMCK